MTQIPQPIPQPIPPEQEAMLSPRSPASPAAKASQAPVELEITELKYYSATASKRLRSRMQTAAPTLAGRSGPGPAAGTAAGTAGDRRQRLNQYWSNLSLRNKFALLMVVSATVPTVAVTQSLVALNKNRAIVDAKEFALQQGSAFRDEYVLWAQTDASSRSANLARLVQASGIDPSDPESDRAPLNNYIALDPFADPETAMNFQIVIDLKGRSIAQDIRLLQADPAVPADLDQALEAVQMLPVQAPLNQDLRSLPLVQKVLSNGIPAAGIERLSREMTQVLGLAPQLQQGDSTVAREGRTLTALSISPVLVNGSTRGAVIVGQVLNNNSILADVFKLRYGISSAGVFDGNQLILSTDGDGKGGRQTQAAVSAKTLESVFEQGKSHLEVTQRDGHSYLNYYSPIYGSSLSGSSSAGPAADGAGDAQPVVGMTYLGQSLQAVEARFWSQQLLAYGLGGATILLSTLLALPAAGSLVQPLQRLAELMGRLGRGDRGLRLADSDRQDEIGQLSRNMNHLATNLECNEQFLQTALWQNNILSEVANLRSLDSHSMGDGMTQILETTRQRLKLDRLVVYRCGSTAENGRVLYEARLSRWPSTIELGISDDCIPLERLEQYRQGEIQVNPDVSRAGLSDRHLELLATLKVKASIIAPMVSGGALYGLLVAHSCADTRSWDQATVKFMGALADRVAAAVGYVTLLEQQREAEETIRQDKEILQQRALELLQAVDPVSQGDLTVSARVTSDEIGTVADSYNATIESLRRIVGQVKTVATQVTDTAQVNDVAVQKLAQDALSQANQITGSLANLDRMIRSVQTLSAQALEAQSRVDATQATVSAGEQAMGRTVEGMATIRETVSETTQKMQGLEAASQRISNVIRLISGFAAQTHMLAMKASIEAARAGDQGEGFAVIADEVRSLAAQSAQATADVETVINTIQMATQDVIAAMEVETHQVAQQMQLVEDTRASLTQITAASGEVNELVAAIAQTTEFQTQASAETATTIAEVAQLVRATSDEASQVSESFKRLLEVSQALQAEVAQFKVS
ncbi:MAG: HAMP domain-containing protein [Synechococcales cyanobacterium RM1_1_8]|nr:HAMP domain-containing protein [Synechococcales cyanobacterium RM1_1_8]